MARADGRLEPGQRLNGAISARAWNRAQEAADIVLADRYSVAGGTAGVGLKPYTWAYCKASVTVPRWGILAITGMDITPTSTESDTSTRSFQDCPVLTGGTPSETTTAWCVAVEPIESGKIGRVAVAGVVQCKASDLGQAAGAHVLWKNSDWALVRINAGVIRGTFDGTWAKGSTTTVYDSAVPDARYTAKNYLATITGATCLIAYVADEWVLIGWDWHALQGYSGSAQQILAHNTSGQLVWLNTTACT